MNSDNSELERDGLAASRQTIAILRQIVIAEEILHNIAASSAENIVLEPLCCGRQGSFDWPESEATINTTSPLLTDSDVVCVTS